MMPTLEAAEAHQKDTIEKHRLTGSFPIKTLPLDRKAGLRDDKGSEGSKEKHQGKHNNPSSQEEPEDSEALREEIQRLK